MIENAIRDWLNDLNLNAELTVLGLMALKLAADLDDKGNTSTAAELRKTILEISRQVNGTQPEFDPLAEMLKR